MSRLVDHRWFALFQLVCAVGAAVWVAAQPSQLSGPESGGPLLVALIPWALRLLAGRLPFRPASTDLLLGVFLATAAISVTAAYDPAPAWYKLWVLVGAALVGLALTVQPKANLWLVVIGLSALGVGVTAFFLVVTDWQQQPADLAVINRLVAWWGELRPASLNLRLNRNFIGGILAMLLPFSVAIGVWAWRRRAVFGLAWAGLSGLIIAFGLLLSSSRGAWLALIGALGVWALWGVSVRLTARFTGRPGRVLALSLAIAGVLIAAGLSVFPGGLVGVANRLPGLRDADSRLELLQNTWDLTQDFALTGLGLASFAGPYSRYMLVIHDFVFDYGHNLYLDVAVEQGVIGALAFLGIYLGSAVRLYHARRLAATEPDDGGLVYWAALAGLLVVALHGVVDDPLYGARGTPLLFVLPGLSVALAAAASPAPASVRAQAWGWLKPQLAALGVVAAVLLAYAFPWRASVYANLGAVEMAKRELAGWPEARWSDRRGTEDLAAARAYFEQALALNPHQHTAIYRLGLIEAQDDNYAAAVTHLEAAFQGRQVPRGLTKTLGYLYVWTGQFDQAGPLLAQIPEARYEMSVYSWWWGTQARDDLALNATQMEARLGEMGLPLTGDPTFSLDPQLP